MNRRTQCLSNLKQTALASLLWANDQETGFPWHHSQSNVFDSASQCFSALSNELVTPKVLTCPADKARDGRTLTFENLQDRDVSYFLGLDATNGVPDAILFGDRDVSGLGISTRCLLSGVNARAFTKEADWEGKIHQNIGNVALSDGSVQTAVTQELRELIEKYRSPCGGSHVLRPVP